MVKGLQQMNEYLLVLCRMNSNQLL